MLFFKKIHQEIDDIWAFINKQQEAGSFKNNTDLQLEIERLKSQVLSLRGLVNKKLNPTAETEENGEQKDINSRRYY